MAELALPMANGTVEVGTIFFHSVHLVRLRISAGCNDVASRSSVIAPFLDVRFALGADTLPTEANVSFGHEQTLDQRE